MPPEPASGVPPDPDSATARPVEPFDSAADPFDSEVSRALLDALIGGLPEFVPTYLALAEACDDDPGEPLVFGELADFVADRLDLVESGRPVLERALGLIEARLDAADDDADLIGLAFFDSFSPEDRRRLVPWLGPRSRATLESLDAPDDDG